MTHTCTLASLFHSLFSEWQEVFSADMCYQASVLAIEKHPLSRLEGRNRDIFTSPSMVDRHMFTSCRDTGLVRR